MLAISRDDVVRLGKDPETAVKLDAATFGLKSDMYAAQLDVFHLLHCLNNLRQLAYRNYYNETYELRADMNESTFYEVHLNHCVGMLAEAIQCSGNANLVTMHWFEGFDNPTPDFSIQRKCVDFEGLTKWRKENEIDLEFFSAVNARAPLGQKKEPDPVPKWWPGGFKTDERWKNEGGHKDHVGHGMRRV